MNNKVAILIISHNDIGSVLVKTAKVTYGKELPLPIHTVNVKPNSNPDLLIPELKQLIKQQLDQGFDVLILTDLFGATPCNIAQEIQTNGVTVICGLNLPMLIRVINYPNLALDQLAATALQGGQTGIIECEAKED